MVPSGMVPTGSTLPMLSWAARSRPLGVSPRPAQPPPPPPAAPRADAKPTLLAAVHELARVDALGGDEQLRPLLKPVRIPEDHLGEGCAAARVVDDVLRAERA